MASTCLFDDFPSMDSERGASAIVECSYLVAGLSVDHRKRLVTSCVSLIERQMEIVNQAPTNTGKAFIPLSLEFDGKVVTVQGESPVLESMHNCIEDKHDAFYSQKICILGPKGRTEVLRSYNHYLSNFFQVQRIHYVNVQFAEVGKGLLVPPGMKSKLVVECLSNLTDDEMKEKIRNLFETLCR